MSLTLDVAIATYQPEGIKRVEKMLSGFPPRKDVKYIVSWQEYGQGEVLPSLQKREDVEIHFLDQKGLSNNRNNALSHCKGDIILIADDDLVYEKDFADIIINTFETDPKLDFATFKFDYKVLKHYPSKDCSLTVPFPKNYYGSNVEFAFKREKIGSHKYWSGIGPGTNKLTTGEDEIFLIEAIRKGLNCRFFNKKLGSHPTLTTGDRYSPGISRGHGYIITTIYPMSWIIRIPLKAWRNYRSGKSSFFSSLFYLTQGALTKITEKNR